MIINYIIIAFFFSKDSGTSSSVTPVAPSANTTAPLTPPNVSSTTYVPPGNNGTTDTKTASTTDLPGRQFY